MYWKLIKFSDRKFLIIVDEGQKIIIVSHIIAILDDESQANTLVSIHNKTIDEIKNPNSIINYE